MFGRYCPPYNKYYNEFQVARTIYKSKIEFLPPSYRPCHPSAGAAERSAVFLGIRTCMFEAAQPQVAANSISLCARKTVRSEGSLAKPNLRPQSPFFCFLSLARQRKRGLRRRTSFCEVKTKPSLEGFVLTKLKQVLCGRACFYAAKRVLAPA